LLAAPTWSDGLNRRFCGRGFAACAICASEAGFPIQAAPRGEVRKPQPLLRQDVLDKDINALNKAADVETEN
jgi:hypothetical protein